VAAGRAHWLALVGGAIVARPSVAIQRANNNLNVMWSDGSFQLQTSTNIFDALSWQVVGGVTNLYMVNPSERGRFFRLIKN
jgi:hypothetical protein